MIEIIQGGSVNINVSEFATSRGWRVVTDYRAIHQRPNSGYIEFNNYTVQEGFEYEISYSIISVSGGIVRVEVSNQSLGDDSNAGYYQKTITPTNDGTIRIFSDADATIDNFSIKKKITEQSEEKEDTILFNSDRRGWITFTNYVPESGMSMYTDLITFKDGDLWLHCNEAIPNNFYGRQFHSTVKFPVSSVGVKTYNSIAIHSNKVIGTTEDGIESELGDVTDLISYDFSTREGIHYANLMRDSLTNNLIQGRYLVIELSDEESKDKKLEIFKIVVKGNINTPNE